MSDGFGDHRRSVSVRVRSKESEIASVIQAVSKVFRPRVAIGALVLGASLACAPEGGVGPVPRVDTEGLDPAVAGLFRNLVREARSDPTNASARGRLGLAYDANAIPGAAIEAYEQAAALDSTDARWAYHAACVRAFGGDVERALSSLDRVLRLRPDYAPAHWRRGKWLLDLGRLDEAEASFLECARLEPGSRSVTMGLARLHLQRGEPAEVLRLLEPLASAAPSDSHVQHLLAAAYRRTGELERAREGLARTESPKETDRPDPWRDERRRYRVGFAADLEKGIALLEAGHFAQGIEVLEPLRRDHPNDVTLLSNLGAAYCATGRVGAGRAALEAALRERPGHYPTQSSLIEALEVSGEHEEALAWAEKAVAANPSLGPAHLKRAHLLMRLGRRSDALQSFEAAHRLGTRSAEDLFWSGRLLSDGGRWAEAVSDLRGALELDPRMAPARLALARGLAETGDFQGARHELSLATASMPGSAQVAGVRDRIEALERGEGR